MAWNEPGGNKDKDPWGGGGNGKNQGPPDLDEVVRKLQDKLSSILGGGRGKAGGSGSSKGPIGLIIVAAII